MYIKINNLVQSDGYADYKGLDINKIVAGSQQYPNDENVAYFQYISEESIPDNSDIVIIDDIAYKAVLETELAKKNNNAITELQTQLQQVQKDNLTALEGVAEVYEQLLTMQS